MVKQKPMIYWGCIILLLFSGIYIRAAKSITYFVLSPPEQMLEDVKKVAVLDFTGTGSNCGLVEGRKASDYIIAGLLQKDRGIHSIEKGISRFLKAEGIISEGSVLNKLLGKRKKGKTFQQGISTDFFDISERSRIKQVIEEQHFSNSGMVEPNQAAELGKVLGVDAVINGDIRIHAEKKQYHNTLYDEYYYMNEVTATLSMRIVGVGAGQIIGQKIANRKVKGLADKCSMDAVRDEAIKIAAMDLVFYFAPSFKKEKIKYQLLQSKEYKKDNKTALRFLEAGELTRALVIYTSIVNKDPYNHNAIYMQGVLYELACNYDTALERYRLASEILEESDTYSNAIQRVTGQKAMWQELKKQDIYLQTMNLEISTEQLERVNWPKVRLKGNSAIRIPVYANPNKGELVMKIPGGLTVSLIDKQDNYYKVKLITGQEGFVHKRDVH